MSISNTIDDNNSLILGYHNHNFFCDGLETIEKYIEYAINQELNAIGFSSHAPFFFYNKWSISEENSNNYVQEINFLAKKYKNQIQVLKALEIDYLPNQIAQFAHFKTTYQLDYTIGSIHYVQHPKTKELFFIDGPSDEFDKNLLKVFSGDIQLAIEAYFNQTKEMILTQSPDIIGHIDKISMNAAKHILVLGKYPNWYLKQIENVLDVAAAAGSIVELNLRGLIKGKWHTTFIDEQFLPLCNSKNVKMVISTDAHHPREIIEFYNYGLKLLLNAGFKSLQQFGKDGWKPYKLSSGD